MPGKPHRVIHRDIAQQNEMVTYGRASYLVSP